MEKVYGFESFLIEKPLPVRLKDMADEGMLKIERDNPGAVYLLSTEPGYDLPFEVRADYHLRENKRPDEDELPDIAPKGEHRIAWLAQQVSTAFSRLVTGLKA